MPLLMIYFVLQHQLGLSLYLPCFNAHLLPLESLVSMARTIRFTVPDTLFGCLMVETLWTSAGWKAVFIYELTLCGAHHSSLTCLIQLELLKRPSGLGQHVWHDQRVSCVAVTEWIDESSATCARPAPIEEVFQLIHAWAHTQYSSNFIIIAHSSESCKSP